MLIFRAWATCDVICQERWIRASSRGPDTEKQIRARGQRLSAFVFFEVFGTRHEARSPIFWHVISSETIKMQMQVFDLKKNMFHRRWKSGGVLWALLTLLHLPDTDDVKQTNKNDETMPNRALSVSRTRRFDCRFYLVSLVIKIHPPDPNSRHFLAFDCMNNWWVWELLRNPFFVVIFYRFAK